MDLKAFLAIFLPFAGTVLGAGFVFFLKGAMNRTLQRSLTGFAAGVMVAASIWSLIIPAMDQSEHMGSWHSCRPLWASGVDSCSCCCWIM